MFFKTLLYIIYRKIMLIMGILSLLYFFMITYFIGYLNVYNLIWIFIGSFFIAFYKFKIKIMGLYKKLPKIVKLFFVTIMVLFLLSFLIIEGLVINNAKNKNSKDAYYLIILGAGLNGSSPSLTLLQRINVAVNYLKKNINSNVVVSGGQGFHEIVTEAKVMATLLENNGIEKNRIIVEDVSTNTYENLIFSGNLININKKIVIVSSGFHLFRAKSIARKIGYKDIGGIGSKTPPLLLLNYYVREYFAVIKEIITGNI
ncbi:hypothetical protein FACS189485_20120 [Spirochaetia bacterium]|nr:hypothetical protein FACS189485_20120 [Spirochaetia bacterium]